MEKAKMSQNGVGMPNMNGDAADGGMAREDSAVRPGEAQEGASRVGVGYEGGLEQKAYGEPLNGLREQNAENDTPKKAKKSKILAILGILILVAIGCGVWWMIEGNEEKVNDEDPEPVVEQVVELDLDSELIRGLYGNFANLTTVAVDAEGKRIDELSIYRVEPGLGAYQEYLVALDNVEESLCVVSHTIPNYPGSEQTTDYEAGVAICKAGEQMRAKMREIFGEDIDLAYLAGERLVIGGRTYVYEVEGDETVYIGAGEVGGAGRLGVMRRLYGAEQKGDTIYLYEAAVIPCVAKIDEMGCFLGGGIASEHGLGDDVEQRYYHVSGAIDNAHGERIPELDMYMDQFEILEHLDVVDHFKWTFEKNEAGNYIFRGIERAEYGI